MSKEDKFVLTEWGCLYAVLLGHGIQLNISGEEGAEIVEEFMDLMCRAGHAEKAEKKKGNKKK